MKISLALLSLLGIAGPVSASTYLVYFGTYTGPKSQGIYVSRFDTQTGKLENARLAGEISQPSWVAIHPKGKVLYAVTETGYDGGEGSITSFAISPGTGELKQINKVSSGGGAPCHLTVDKAGKTIFVANYASGSVAGFRLESDGRLGERTAFSQHKGSSVNQRRQRGPHAHAVVLSADNKFLVVPDLGLDEFVTYRFDAGAGTITPNDPPFVKVSPGLGPRHFAFHPSGKFAYGLDEMGSSVTAFTWDGTKGVLTELHTISNLPADFKGEDNSAEIEVDRAGRFVYASNRGDDSITVFAVQKDGRLQLVEKVSTQGQIPRSFSLDPTGTFLLAANQKSNNVAVFRVDKKSGRLTPTGQTVEVPAAVCLQFLKQ